MAIQLHTSFLPNWTHPHRLAGDTVIVIDVLRATTSIVQAFMQGATSVMPFLEINEAREHVRRHPEVLLAGERGGIRPEGFDLGNSPSEYTVETVAGRRIAMTTTNGTRAMIRCVGAGHVLVGAFSNLKAVCERACRTSEPVHLLCAGTDGEVTREDVLCAGAIAQQMESHGACCRQDDLSRIARDAWLAVGPQRLLAELFETRGGRNLLQIGQGDDLADAAQIDCTSLVPVLDLTRWQIVLAE